MNHLLTIMTEVSLVNNESEKDHQGRPLVRERAERYEIIAGQVYDMSPSPTSRHQIIAGNIFTKLVMGMQGSSCGVFMAPLDVWPTGTDRSEVVQPDVFVVCDCAKIIDAGCYGAPDLIVEVLSPSTAKKDRLVKLELYQRSHVTELWLVDPAHQTIEAFHLHVTGYALPSVYSAEDDDLMTVHIGTHPPFTIGLKDVFHHEFGS